MSSFHGVKIPLYTEVSSLQLCSTVYGGQGVGIEGVLCMYTEMLLVGIEWFYFIFIQGFKFCCNYCMMCPLV